VYTELLCSKISSNAVYLRLFWGVKGSLYVFRAEKGAYVCVLDGQAIFFVVVGPSDCEQ
jgi:hypothetical protein